MFKSSLIETLKTFSKQEIKDLGLFIQSPFFNTNHSVIKLYEQIKKLYPEFEAKKLNKEILFEKAFGKVKYNDSFMRMTIFRFQELVKEFLINRNLQRNYLMKETFLLEELNIRELNNLILKSINELDKKIEKQKPKEAESYFVKFKLEYFRNEIKARDTKMITYKDALDEDLMLEQKNLNIFYFTSSLKFFQYFLNQKDFVVNAEGYPEFMNHILEFLKVHTEYLDARVLNTYYCLVLMLITKDDKNFFDLKKILFEDKDDLSYVEKYNVITVLRNYAQRKYQEGHIQFAEEVFDLLKYTIDNDMLTSSPESKYISETRFMNIVWSSLRAKEFDWIENFMTKYINKIEPDKREYVLAYNTARLEFEKKNYSEALEKLGKSGSIKNIFYKAATKQLTIMIYYELRWLIPAADLLDAFRHFVRTDKLLPEIYKIQCNSFINYFQRLLRINDNTGNKSFETSELIAELKSTPLEWLLKKAQELDKNNY